MKQFFKSHGAQYGKTNQKRVELLCRSLPLTTDPGIIKPQALLAKTLALQLKQLLQSLQEFEKAIAVIYDPHEDAVIFNSFPGAGEQLAPRLLVAFGADRGRYSKAQELAQLAGVAPVTEASGKKSWVHWRWFCPKFMRQTFVEWADQSRRKSFWAKAFYEQQKREGKTHQMAIRALAFKWIRILFRCWQDRKPYDEAKYLLALKKKGSPLVAKLAL